MFSCEFCEISKNTFLQNTSGLLLLQVEPISGKHSYLMHPENKKISGFSIFLTLPAPCKNHKNLWK